MKSDKKFDYNAEHELYVKKAGEDIVEGLIQLRHALPVVEKANIDKLLALCNFQEEVSITDRLVSPESTPFSKTPKAYNCLYALVQYLIVTHDTMLRTSSITEEVKKDFTFFIGRFKTIVQEGFAVYRVRGNPENGYQLVHVKDLQI